MKSNKHKLTTLYLLLCIIFLGNSLYADYFHLPQSFIAIPDVTTGTQDDDIEVIKRAVAAYRNTIEEQKYCDNSSLWSQFFYRQQADIHKMFMRAEIKQIANVLRNPALSDLFYGFENLAKTILRNHGRDPNFAPGAMDCLIRFAAAIGAIRLENPESYIPTQWTADEILLKIGQKLNGAVPFPNPFPLEHGLKTSYGVVSYRACQALYQAWRIKQLVKDIPNPRILEIGAGLGRTAFYARWLGIKDYTIVDLPMAAISSSYFLGRTLGKDHVLFAGENAQDADQRVKWITPSEFLASTRSYDLIINADGLTEMDQNVALAYFQKIEKNTTLFLSINHENNPFTVRELLDISTYVEEGSRMPYWMRNGYVEELVRFKR